MRSWVRWIYSENQRLANSCAGVGKTMDVSLENLKQAMEPRWAHFGRRKTLETSERAYEMMQDEVFQKDVVYPR